VGHDPTSTLLPPSLATAALKEWYNWQVAAQVAVCANHAQRAAIGVCVRCRTRVCSECSTKVDGINYCVACLAGLAVDSGSRAAADNGKPRAELTAAVLYTLAVSLLLWGFLELMLPGGS
jgi:hypothetical protein